MINNIILQTITGSHLYGTNIETSDTDRVGIFMPDREQLFGLTSFDIVDESQNSKDSNGKNSKAATDLTYYSLRKFMTLALQNNPNILEILFVKDPEIIDFYGTWLIEHRQSFIHQGLRKRFIGYAISQKHKMFIKSENYTDLEDTCCALKEFIASEGEDKLLLVGVGTIFKLKRNFDGSFKIGDLNLQRNITIKGAIKMLDERLSKATHRKDMYTKYGYDLKFAMHTLRLLYEAIELITSKKITFPLNAREHLKEIRRGKFTLDQVKNFIDAAIRNIDTHSSVQKAYELLPKKPPFNLINKLTIEMLTHFTMSSDSIKLIGKIKPLKK